MEYGIYKSPIKLGICFGELSIMLSLPFVIFGGEILLAYLFAQVVRLKVKAQYMPYGVVNLSMVSGSQMRW